MSMIVPNFLIAGAGKSGTTFLAKMLGCHPDIYIPEIKEPCYFSTHPVFGANHKGLEFYYKHFETYTSQRMIGEASTVYMYDDKSPALIREALGDIPLVFVLRDPVARIHSNYWQEAKAGASMPSFSEFVRIGGDRFEEMMLATRYERHIRNYEGEFSKKNILLLDYMRLIESPQDVVNEVFGFLGVGPFVINDVDGVEKNVAAVARNKFVARLFRNRKLANFVKSSFPAKSLSSLKRIGDTLKAKNLATIEYAEVEPDTEVYLKEELAATYEFMHHHFK